MDVLIRTDGSALNQGQKAITMGGAAFIVKDSNNQTIYQRMIKPNFAYITNNRCELFAFYNALLFVRDHNDIKARIESDSLVLVNGINGSAKRKANRDLWELIEGLVPSVSDRIISVSHISSEENCEADLLAFQAANAILINQEGEWLDKTAIQKESSNK